MKSFRYSGNGIVIWSFMDSLKQRFIRLLKVKIGNPFVSMPRLFEHIHRRLWIWASFKIGLGTKQIVRNWTWTKVIYFFSVCFLDLNNLLQIAMPHQWLEGNLPVSAKCAVCDKTCGSVLRLQDWKCLWCKAMVGPSCFPKFIFLKKYSS